MACVAAVSFFFFQAEDGIRDVAVTGVQTCALPICSRLERARYRRRTRRARWCCVRSRRGCDRSEEHTSELQSRLHLVCRLLLEKKKKKKTTHKKRKKNYDNIKRNDSRCIV